MNKNNFKQKGITLLALVITIIILLILAGVTISIAVNNNGIFEGAKKAANITNYESAKEALNLKLIEIQTDCTIREVPYNLDNIDTELLKDNNFIIELYYYKETRGYKKWFREKYRRNIKGNSSNSKKI